MSIYAQCRYWGYILLRKKTTKSRGFTQVPIVPRLLKVEQHCDAAGGAWSATISPGETKTRHFFVGGYDEYGWGMIQTIIIITIIIIMFNHRLVATTHINHEVKQHQTARNLTIYINLLSIYQVFGNSQDHPLWWPFWSWLASLDFCGTSNRSWQRRLFVHALQFSGAKHCACLGGPRTGSTPSSPVVMAISIGKMMINQWMNCHAITAWPPSTSARKWITEINKIVPNNTCYPSVIKHGLENPICRWFSKL